jgi:hypothetical protein
MRDGEMGCVGFREQLGRGYELPCLQGSKTDIFEWEN